MRRRYTGTAGRIENTQVAVYLTYTTRAGHAMIDHELYLPRSWVADPDRRAAAGVPDEVDFLTEPALAAAMLTRAAQAQVPARWATGDEVYGADPALRAQLERLGLGYVLAIGCDRRVPTHGRLLRPDHVAAALPEHCWQRLERRRHRRDPRRLVPPPRD
ncbi:transposase [Pseudonocardia sp. H11422]|uniref:IS701 family transposase n=1 Tax=Pseudonocardia sp. H11422 TaxID=2835866 RepID=UPI0027E252AC|nr:transposase [Pseudonocardia sp. H11422]